MPGTGQGLSKPVAYTRTEQRLEGAQTMGEGQLAQVKHLKRSPEETSLVLRLG